LQRKNSSKSLNRLKQSSKKM